MWPSQVHTYTSHVTSAVSGFVKRLRVCVVRGSWKRAQPGTRERGSRARTPGWGIMSVLGIQQALNSRSLFVHILGVWWVTAQGERAAVCTYWGGVL